MRNLSFALPVLMLAAAAPAPSLAFARADAAKPAVDPDKPICKREQVIGTLVGARKVCHTRAEWQALRDDAQRDTQAIQGGAGGQTPQ